tara:strand:+ start:64 stop:597 length:534 start_codon:yes stop_codon:yes gene_type:complete
MENTINVFDNVLTPEQNRELYEDLLYSGKFMYGEVDDDDHPPTGMVCNLKTEQVNLLYEIAINKQECLKDQSINRVYANLFRPGEQPFFHEDESVYTCLFYVNPPTTYEDGGQTEFVVDDNIFGLLPRPGQLVIFDGKIPHRATSFRTQPRITIALKFNCPEENIANGPSGNVPLNN